MIREWRPGGLIPLRQRVHVPARLPPGRYWLELGWYDPLTGRRPVAVDANGRVDGDRIIVGPLKVPASPAPPQPDEVPANAQFSDQIALRGYAVEVTPQQVLVRLRLQALVHPAAEPVVDDRLLLASIGWSP